MRRIYDLKLVYDYIWGNDIEDYNVEDFENDPEFMLQVMVRSKDKNMYDLCSDSVKSEYGFDYEVINLFKDDLEFVCLVADNYVDSLSEAEKIHGTSYPEINILMSSLCGKSLNQYSISTATFYEYERHRALISIGRVDDLEVKEESAAGFIISFVQYENSPIILNFIAKRMVNESLYGDRDNNLEYLIHSNFRSIDDFENYGEVNFLCNCIYDYDRNLCSYVFDKNSDVDFKLFFGQALKEIARVKRDWSLYMDRVNAWRVMVFNQELADYMLQDGEIGRLSHDEIISYVAKKLGISDVFSKFDVDFPDTYDEENYKILETVDVNNLNKAMSIARGLFSKDVIDEDYDDYVTDDDKDSSKKVVRFQLVDHKKGRGI